MASIGDSFPEVGQEIDVEMICVPDDDSEPLVPTFEMLAPGGGSTVDPEPGSVFGDAGSVFASWVFDAPGLYQLVVSCESSVVYDIEVGATGDTTGDGTDGTNGASDTTERDLGAATTNTGGASGTLPATGASDGIGAGAVAAVAAVAVGGACIVAARRRAG